MPHTFVLSIKEAGIGDIEMTHEIGEIAKRSFHQQMEMVRHQGKGVELDRVDIERPRKKTQKHQAVILTQEVIPSIIPPAHNMVNSTWVLNT
jgi:hypothetical protein